MSVSLEEVIRKAGYNILEDVEDAKWLLSLADEWEELIEKAEELEEMYNDYLDCKDTAEEDGDYGFPSFEEWRDMQDGK